MADGNLATDLFGDPVLPRREGRGRPPHMWSRENSNRVLLAFARGLDVKAAARAVGISVPTLYKVYFNECGKRADARLRMEMTQLAHLSDLAMGGSVSAHKELFRQLEKLRQRDQAAIHQAAAPEPTPTKLGKKEAAKIAADRVTGLYEPPAPPGQTVQ